MVIVSLESSGISRWTQQDVVLLVLEVRDVVIVVVGFEVCDGEDLMLWLLMLATWLLTLVAVRLRIKPRRL